MTRATKSQHFSAFSNFMNVHKPNFSLMWAIPKLLGQIKPKFIIRSKFLAAQFFILIDILLSYNNRCWHAFAILVKFWHNIGFFATSDVIMLFCHYWTIESTLGVVILRGGARGVPGGATAPPKFCLAPPKFSAWRHATALKSYTDHWQLPLLQNWPLQWPPKWKCLSPPLVILDVKVQQYTTVSVISGDFLTLDVSLVRLDWFSSMVLYFRFRWLFHTFDFSFISTEK